jgi:hypothetical protein
MRTIRLISTGLFWCVEGKPEKEIYLHDIFNWQKQGLEIVFVNGVFGDLSASSFENILADTNDY